MSQEHKRTKYTKGIANPDDPLLADFTARVGQTFFAHADVPVALKLSQVEPMVKLHLPEGAEIPADLPQGAHLVFEGPEAASLPEGHYSVHVDDDKVIELHIMPIHSPGDTQLYQAFHDE